MDQKELKFVIQEHTTGQDTHWDFMLESAGKLQTYRLDKAPAEILHTSANAVKIFDHRLEYLTYQGPVSNGRGHVHIVDAGGYKITHQSPNRIELDLYGRILKGRFVFTCIEQDNWQFSGINHL